MPGNPDFQQFLTHDKLLHLIAYTGLASLPPLFLNRPRTWIRYAIFLILLGILLEGAQGLTPMRTPSFYDVLANTAGVTLGTLVGLLSAKVLNLNRSVQQ